MRFNVTTGLKIEPSELRVVTASNKPECIRDDLKDRFKCLRIPSLVERTEDIPILLKHFLKNSNISGITGYTLRGMSETQCDIHDYGYIYHWKGNVRELKKVVEDAIFLCGKRQTDTLASQDFPSISWDHERPERMDRELYRQLFQI